MASRYRLESLQRLSTQLSSEIASSTPRSPRASVAADSPSASEYRATASAASPYASPRAFYTPRLTESATTVSSSTLNLPPSSPSPVPLNSSGGGTSTTNARLARLEEQTAATSKRIDEVDSFCRDKLQTLQSTLTEALFRCQGQIDTQYNNFTQLVTKLERKIHEIDDDHSKRALDNHSFCTQSIADMHKRLADVAGEVTSSCSHLEERTKTGFEKTELELASSFNAMSQRITGEVDQLNKSLSSLNDKWVNICIGLDNKAVRLDNAQQERAQASELLMNDRLEKLATELAESRTQLQATTDTKLTNLNDATGEKLDKITRQIESTNRALAHAQEEAKFHTERSASEMSDKMSSIVDELGQRIDSTKTTMHTYVDAEITGSGFLTRTEHQTAKVLLEMRVKDTEDAVKELAQLRDEIDGCCENCSQLAYDVSMIEAALEAKHT